MTFEEKRAALIELIDFFQSNEGNKLNKYMTVPFINNFAAKFKISIIPAANNSFGFKDLTAKDKPQATDNGGAQTKAKIKEKK